MKINKIPVVFAFDNNYTIPVCIAITSLLENAESTTSYVIYCLHNPDLEEKNKEKILSLKTAYSNFEIVFLNMGNAFKESYEIRNISYCTYYRLLIPELLSQYDKVIYSDVDIIFLGDLHNVYESDLKEYYIAASPVSQSFLDVNSSYLDKLSREYKINIKNTYFNAGFLIFNNKKIREDNLTKVFLDMSVNDYLYQDQDILNISCQNKTKILPVEYNYTPLQHRYIYEELKKSGNKITGFSPDDKFNIPTVLHWPGKKPWLNLNENYSFVYFQDFWWEYYKKSIFFDYSYYLEYQEKQEILKNKLALIFKKNKVLLMLKKIIKKIKTLFKKVVIKPYNLLNNS